MTERISGDPWRARCRPMTRRSVLQAGVLGGLGLTLADVLRAQGAENQAFTQQAGEKKAARALSVIQLHLGGGLQQQESLDPKPEAPVEVRGLFGVTKTRSGDVLSDNLPRTVTIADKATIIRSLVGKIPDHGQATYHLFTGYTPTAVIDYPQIGSVISHELGKRGELPPYIAIPNKNAYSGGTGYLSSAYGPFETSADPGQSNYRVQDFSIPEGVSLERFDRRRTARQIIEQRIRQLDADPGILETMDDFHRQAYTMLTSATAQGAFSLAEESEATRKLYGSDVVGLLGPDNRYHPKGLAERLIVARRLVEAGVRFVTVTYGSWDCHVDVKSNTLDQVPALDAAIAGLITDLDQRGLLETTIFWVTTEFGRTPKVNADGGRDHWARCYSNLIAGGGFASGLIYGASDATGAEPVRDALPLEDLLYTIYHQLGIDANKELLAFGTRPIEIINGGRLAPGLLA